MALDGSGCRHPETISITRLRAAPPVGSRHQIHAGDVLHHDDPGASKLNQPVDMDDVSVAQQTEQSGFVSEAGQQSLVATRRGVQD